MENIVYLRHKEKLQEAINSGDTEVAHAMADDILCMIAKDATLNHLNVEEVETLIQMYHSVEKWFG
jgi:hypothetical protein